MKFNPMLVISYTKRKLDFIHLFQQSFQSCVLLNSLQYLYNF